MNFLRRLLKAIRNDRIRAHKRWLRRNRVLMPKPRPDDRNWSGAYMDGLRHG